MGSNSQSNTPGVRREQSVFLQSGDPTLERRPISTNGVVDSYIGGQLGQKFDSPDPTSGLPAEWQIVETDSVMDTKPYDGAVAWWANQALYLVTTKIANAGRGNRAGIFRDSSAPQDPATHNLDVNQIVCIQKKGQAVQVNFVDSPTAAPSTAGLFVIPSATDAKADCLAAATAATYPPIGLSAGAAGAVAAHYAAVDVDINDNI